MMFAIKQSAKMYVAWETSEIFCKEVK